MRQNVKGFLHIFTSNWINLLVNFISFPIIARSLSYEHYATYGQVVLYGSFFQVLFGLGIVNVINIIFATFEKRIKDVFQTGLLVIALSNIGGILLVLLFGYYNNMVFNNPDFFYNLLFYLPAIFLINIIYYVFATFVFIEKSGVVSAINICFNILKALGFVVIASKFKTSQSILIWISLISLLQFTTFLFFLPKGYLRMKFSMKVIDPEIRKQMLQVGMPMMMTGLIAIGIIQVSSVIISHLLSPKDFSIFRNGAIEFPFVSIIFSSVTTVMMPTYSKMITKNEIGTLLSVKRKINNYTALIIFPVCFMLALFSKPLIILYLSTKYELSAGVFAIYNLALLVRFNDYQDLLVISKKTNLILLNNLVFFLISIPLSYWMIDHFGIMGAVVSFLMTLYLLASGLVVSTIYALKIKLTDYFDLPVLLRALIVNILLAALFYPIVSRYLDHYVIVFGLIVCYLIALHIVYLFSGLQAYREIYEKVMQKIKQMMHRG
ncbi:MAG: hypothetical protein JNJ58_13265 [Chitinophagaceae bacterium]|nr:hypothetical protein [Chitinophagaceae bacterium]